MTPPEAPVAQAGTTPPAVSVYLKVMQKRSDFIAASRAKRQGTHGMMVQARNRKDDDPHIRVGFTCSKKVGNAVARNRAKRRLRAVAHDVLLRNGKAGWDYVLIGRFGATIERDFAGLSSDLKLALQKLHRAS